MKYFEQLTVKLLKFDSIDLIQKKKKNTSPLTLTNQYVPISIGYFEKIR